MTETAGVVIPHAQHKFRVLIDGHPAVTQQVISFKENGDFLEVVLRDDVNNVVFDTFNRKTGSIFDLAVEIVDGEDVIRSHDYDGYRMTRFESGIFDYASTKPHTFTLRLRQRREMDINVPN